MYLYSQRKTAREATDGKKELAKCVINKEGKRTIVKRLAPELNFT
jgi:hypothetical protein